MSTTQFIDCETQHKQIVRVPANTLVQRISAYGALEMDDKILCVKTHSDFWELPGGTPEPGETIKQALIREFYEEAGLVVAVGSLIYVRESFYCTPTEKAYHSLQFFFHVSALDKTKPLEESPLISLVAIDMMTEKNTNQSSYAAVQKFNDNKVSYLLIDI